VIFEFAPGNGPGEVADVEAFGGEFGCLCDCGGWFVFCCVDMLWYCCFDM